MRSKVQATRQPFPQSFLPRLQDRLRLTTPLCASRSFNGNMPIAPPTEDEALHRALHRQNTDQAPDEAGRKWEFL